MKNTNQWMLSTALSTLVAITVAIITPSAFAVKSAESTDISVNPSLSIFEAVVPNNSSSNNVITVKNTGSNPLIIGGLSLLGSAADQFQLSSDRCSNATLTANTACSVSVSFSPTSRGHKQAVLNIPSDSTDTPLLQAFLTSKEDIKHESSRRLPPILHSLNIPETMTAGQAYTLEWSLLGYHDDYITSIVMFNCTGITDQSCGNDFTNATVFFNSGGLRSHVKQTSNQSNGGIVAQEFKFKTEFTPAFTQKTDIVIRFFRLSFDDLAAGLGGLTLLVPGNLTEHYYDKEGRRIKKTIIP